MAVTKQATETTNAYRCPKCGREVLTCCLRMSGTPSDATVRDVAAVRVLDIEIEKAIWAATHTFKGVLNELQRRQIVIDTITHLAARTGEEK